MRCLKFQPIRLGDSGFVSEIKAKTVRAAGWVAGTRVIAQVISFAFGIALARLLIPDDFGLIAMVLVFTGLANLLSDVGLGAALIQKKDAQEVHFSSVFWLNLAVGCLLAAILYIVAPVLGQFYERVEVEGICRTLALMFPVGALAMVARTRLIKDLEFKYISLSEVVALVISGVVAVTLAVKGFGYWSLVTHILLQQIIKTIIIWNVASWKPTRAFNRDALRILMGFSLSVFATQLLQYITRNIDKLLLGKFLGGQPLGIYDKAQSMMLFPLQNVSHVVGSIMFPSLSLIQSETERVKMIYLRSTRVIALVTFPMMAGMFVVADSFVIGVLGPQWSEVIPVLQIFCFAGVAASIVTVTGALYQSQGAAALQLRVNLITQPIRIAGIVAGLPWGALGVAIGFTATSFINGLITLVIAGRLVNLSIFTLARYLLPIFFPAMLMATVLYIMRPFLTFENELFILLIQVVTGVTFYLACVILMKLEAYKDIEKVLREQYLGWRKG